MSTEGAAVDFLDDLDWRVRSRFEVASVDFDGFMIPAEGREMSFALCFGQKGHFRAVEPFAGKIREKIRRHRVVAED